MTRPDVAEAEVMEGPAPPRQGGSAAAAAPPSEALSSLPARDLREAARAAGLRLRRVRPLRTGDHGALLVSADEPPAQFATMPRAPAGGLTVAGWCRAGRAALGPWRLLGGGLVPLVPALAALAWSAGVPVALAVATLMLAGTALLALHAATLGHRGERDASVVLHGQFWDRLLALAPDAFARIQVPALALRLGDGLRHGLACVTQSAEVVRGALVLAAASAIMLMAAPRLALCALALLVAALPLIVRLAARAAADTDPAHWRAARADDRLAEILPVLSELQQLGATAWLALRVFGANRRARMAGDRARRRHLQLAGIVGALPPLLAVILAGAVLAGATPGLALPDLAAVLLAAPLAARAVALLGMLAGQASARRGRLRALERSIGPGAPADRIGGLPCARIEQLEAKDITFAWPAARAPVMSGLSFTLARGEVVALAGHSGAGKTTLVRLLLGLLEPQSGELLLNGRPLAAYDPIVIRRLMSAVFQDSPFEVTTIAAAVSGSFALSEARIRDLLALVGLTEQVAALPMGLQTLVVEGLFPNSMLGRLLVARALAADPQVIVLDESLDALETVEAAALIARLKARGLTLILCAHDPAIMALADRRVSLGQDEPSSF